MPVTALPPNNTDRFFLDYTAVGAQHVMILRAEDGTLGADAAAAFHALLTAIEDNLTEITILSLRHAVAGSDVTVPIDTGVLNPTYGTATVDPINRPLQVTFTGRSLDGHKTRVGLFGWAGQNDSSWRKTPAEEASVGDALTVLHDESVAGRFVSISGQRVTWNGYMNLGYNDHWVKRARQVSGV